MAHPGGYSKERKKKSAGFNVFLKQRKNRAARIILTLVFFRASTGQKTVNPGKNHKNLRPGGPFPAASRTLCPYICPGRKPEARPDRRPKSNPLTLFDMEFLNKIELRGIVGQSSLNRVGDAQVCRFSLVTEYAYKDRGNNPIVDVTWFNITAWEGKNMPELRQIVKGVIVQVAGRVRTFHFTSADGTERSGWEIMARRVTILPSDDDPVQPQRFL